MSEQVMGRNARPLRMKFDPSTQAFFEEVLQDPAWLRMGYVPRPSTRLGWFLYHVAHGLLMRYPLPAVLRWSWRNSRPEANPQSAELKPDWRDWLYLDPPDIDLRPGHEFVPAVLDEGDGWMPFWGIRLVGSTYVYALGDLDYESEQEFMDFWPFMKPVASAADWQAIGFEVV